MFFRELLLFILYHNLKFPTKSTIESTVAVSLVAIHARFP